MAKQFRFRQNERRRTQQHGEHDGDSTQGHFDLRKQTKGVLSHARVTRIFGSQFPYGQRPDPHDDPGAPHGAAASLDELTGLAIVESSRSTFADSHLGQATPASASCMRRNCSNAAPQFVHRYP
jgi:hypothetical protein